MEPLLDEKSNNDQLIGTQRESSTKKWPIIYLFSDDFGSRSSVAQKALQNKTATSVVARVIFHSNEFGLRSAVVQKRFLTKKKRAHIPVVALVPDIIAITGRVFLFLIVIWSSPYT